MQVDQNLVEQKSTKIKGGHIDFTANDKSIDNYIRRNGKPVGGFIDAYAGNRSEAPSYVKSSAELGMFADDTVIGGTGTYRRPGTGGETLMEQLEMGENLTPEQRHNQMAVLANTASPEDFQKMKEEGFDPGSADTNTVVTVTDKIKASLVEMGDYVKGFTDTLSKEELTQITGNGALAEQISRSMKTHDLPVTEENVKDSVKALEQVRGMGGLSDTAIAYIMKNNLTPTISNLYQAQHMGAGASSWSSGAGVDLKGMDKQIQKIVEESGLPATRGNMEDAKWLLSNQIPLNGKNLEYMQQLKTLSGELEMVEYDPSLTEEITDAMATAIHEGGRPQDAMLVEGYSIQDRAREAYEIIHNATEEDLAYVIANNEPVTVENLSAAMTARSNPSYRNAEAAHVLKMAQRDVELGIGTANPKIALQGSEGNGLNDSEQRELAARMSQPANGGLSESEQRELAARMSQPANGGLSESEQRELAARMSQPANNGLSIVERKELAAKVAGGDAAPVSGLSMEEMDDIVARMTAPPEEIPDVIQEAAASRGKPQRVRGGNIDLMTDGRTENPNYRDPNRGNMVNVTTESLEEMGYAEGRDDYGVYDYSSSIHGALRTQRTTGSADFKGDFPAGYNDYLADYSDNTVNRYPMYHAPGYNIPAYNTPAFASYPPAYYEYPDYAMMTARATVGQRREMNQRINMITSHRQLEEARLCMSMEANQGLLRRGIAIDIRPLEQLVDDLRTQEFYYYEGLLRGNGIMATEERINIFANTTRMITEMQYQPAYILDFGSSMSTIPNLHEAGAAMQNAFQKANQTYESMMTRPNEELGDSISKAFQNIDDILEDLGMELTDENRRAVRILSYNHTELTPENILRMKAADEEVQRTFKNLTPAVTMEMIRQNKNPLDMTIEEVNRLANEIRKDQGDVEVERFSKYLYKMEQNRQITEEQRSGYIGIYRLISQVEKSDGAAIGFLVNQGAEVTMRNLLTAVRSAQRGEMDYEIGDKVVGETPENLSARIDTQIESAFQQNMIRDVAEEITPQKVFEISQEKLMDMSPEQLRDAVARAEDDILAEDAYAQEEYANYSEAMHASEDVYAILDRYDVPNTIINVIAATRLLKSPSQMFKDIWKGGGNHGVAEMKKQVLSRFGEAIKNPEELEAAEEELAETAEDALKEMVEEQDSIRHIDVKEMKILNHQFHICARRAQEECFTVPMRMGGLITGVNLKVVRGKREKGLVDILFDNNKVGRLAASFEAKDHEISGFVAVDRESACSFLNQNIQTLMASIAGEEMENVKLQIVYAPNVSLESYEMKSLKWERKQRERGEIPDPMEPRNPVQTRRLYKIAENFLGGMQKVSKMM